MEIKTTISFDLSDDFHSYIDIDKIKNGTNIEQSATLLWGPYVDIPSGSWKVVFNGMFEAGENESTCDVSTEMGLFTLGTSALCPGTGKIAEIEFSNPTTNIKVEFRVSTAAGSRIRIDSITLQRQADYAHTTAIATSIPNTGRNFKIYQRDGLNLLLDEESLVDHEIIYNGAWEQKQLSYMKEIASGFHGNTSKKVFLDIGSYFGLYSLHMSRINVFDQIIAFEVDEINYRQLQANLLLNDPEFFIKTHNFALSDKDGETFFFPSKLHPSKNRGAAGIIHESHNNTNCVKVSTRALDSLLDLSGHIILAKIDVEGAEFAVLRGMHNILCNNNCVLQIEALIFNDNDVEKHAQIDAFLVSLGYRRIHSVGVDNYYSNFH